MIFTQFNVDYDFFSGEMNENIAVISFKEKPIMHTAYSEWGDYLFFNKIDRRKKTFDILLSGNDVTADEALKLGIVDKIVSIEKLKEAALNVAKTYAQKPCSYLSGIKRLVNSNTSVLRKVLDCENEILRMSM
jgi:enoyl-CoA hydratase/carnithine racemase